jgi:NTP pyrophosphatase (non-canonical NTP hydrolase)
MPDLENILADILAFRDERNWASFHTPKNLSAAIAIEAGELQDTMLWKTDEEVQQMLNSPESKHEIETQLADVLIFALLCCHATRVDPVRAITAKLAGNRKRYPIERASSSSNKNTDFK